MLKIGVVDAHPLFRKAIIDLLIATNLYFCIVEAGNCQDFIETLTTFVDFPDIILCDIFLPSGSGLEVLKWVQLHQPETKVILMSAFAYQACVKDVLALGADAYISKLQPANEFLSVVDQVACCNCRPKPKLNTVATSEIIQYSLLTQREREILALSASDLSYKKIADKLCISENTVEKYRASTFKKLSVNSRVGLVLKAIRNGWIKW